MSNYRRLISYIYAYEGGIKGKNVGFAKLEIRNGQCKIHVNVKKVYIGSQDTGVYLLSGSSEIPIGKIFIRNGAGEFRVRLSAGNVAGSGQSIDQCYGLTIHNLSDSWQSYTTIWEDAVAHAAEVVLEEATSDHIEEMKTYPAQEERRLSSIAEEVEAEIEAQSKQQEQTNQSHSMKKEPAPIQESALSSVIPSLESISPQILRPTELETMEIKPMEVTPIAGTATAEELHTSQFKPKTSSAEISKTNTEKPQSQNAFAEEQNNCAENNNDTDGLLPSKISGIKEDAKNSPEDSPIVGIQPPERIAPEVPEKTPSENDRMPDNERPAALASSQANSAVPEPASPQIPFLTHPFSGRTEQLGQQEWRGQPSRPLQTQASLQSRQGQPNWWFPTSRIFQPGRISYSNRQPHPVQPEQQAPSGHPVGSSDQGQTQYVERPIQMIPPNQQNQQSRMKQPPESAGQSRPSKLSPTAFHGISQQSPPDSSVSYNISHTADSVRFDSSDGALTISADIPKDTITDTSQQEAVSTSHSNTKDTSKNTADSTFLESLNSSDKNAANSTSQEASNTITENTSNSIPLEASNDTIKNTGVSTSQTKLSNASESAAPPASQTALNGAAEPALASASQASADKAAEDALNHISQAELEDQQRKQLKQLEQAKLEEEPKIDKIWKYFHKNYPKIQAFDYNGGCAILTIKPQDIGLLPRETWGYGNNSFLLHGYYNHRYLIFARLNNPKGDPRFLLGVPGHYYSNEKYMAAMFGFPNFVLSKIQPAGDGRFGYWYTDVRLGS